MATQHTLTTIPVADVTALSATTLVCRHGVVRGDTVALSLSVRVMLVCACVCVRVCVRVCVCMCMYAKGRWVRR
eukprot:m.1064116 g.1064116  ORF g.1064116 m.1064116 type:complete len:74 (+) comp24218_c2_seq19:2733-2954(+)